MKVFLAGMELSELQKASAFNLNKVAFCLRRLKVGLQQTRFACAFNVHHGLDVHLLLLMTRAR